MNLNQFYHYYKSKSGGEANLLKATEDFDSSRDWNKLPSTDAPTVSGGITDPNGGSDAQRINFTDNRQARVQQRVSLSASTQYTFSVYARVNTGTEQFRLRNVTLGEAEAKTATTSWTRFSYTFTTTTGGNYDLSIQNSSNDARTIEFWGAMLNVGSSADNYVKVDPSISGSTPTPAYSGFGDSFGDVAAYYSLRKFTEAETLNAIRVRRSSDDTEQDIGFDSNGDLDTTALLAFVGSGGTDNGFVTTWYDQSGNGKNATNATASAQPKIVDGGTLVTEGGKAALDLSSTTYFDLASLTGAFNLFSVISLADKQYVFSKSTDSDMYIRQRTISGIPLYRYRKTVSDYQFASHIVNTRFLFNFNVSNNFVKQNGAQNTNTASTPSEMSVDRLFAASNGTNCVSGVVQEFILLENGNNNDAMETNIDTYFDII